jgi:hypothetical protein
MDTLCVSSLPAKLAEFRKPRGLRFGPDGHFYCVAQDEVVAFDFTKGACLGTTLQFQRLNGQALAFFPCPAQASRGPTAPASHSQYKKQSGSLRPGHQTCGYKSPLRQRQARCDYAGRILDRKILGIAAVLRPKGGY